MIDKYYLLGIISDKRAYNSRSPQMHNKALKEARLKGQYIPLAIFEENLEKTVEALEILGFLGVNVTVPHKEKIIPYLTALDEIAKQVGAVNTLVKTKNGFKGYNTDVYGFKEAISPWGKQKSILVVGTGGAARAVLSALKSENVFLTGRNEEKIIALAQEFQIKPLESFPKNISVDLLINATSASSYEESPPLAQWLKSIKIKQALMDLNYGRINNFWQKEALKQNILFQDGLNMLAYQAQKSFQLWTKEKINLKIFRDTTK